MSMLDALKYQNMARNDPGEYYRQTPIMRAAAERNLGGWLGQAYDQDIKPAYDAWTPQVSDLYNAPKTIAQALGGAVKDSTDTLNAAAPLAMAGDDEATAQAAKASFDLASMYGGSTAAASLVGGVPRGAVLGAHVFQGGPHKYGPEGASESLKHMSKGEGAQAYGYGRYDAENKAVADDYYNTFNDPDQMPLSFKDKPVDVMWNDGIKERWANEIADMTENQKDDFTTVMGNLSQVKSIEDVPNVLYGFNKEQMAMYKNVIEPDLIKKPTEAYLYKHDLPDEDIARYLDYDAPLSEQPESVRAAVKNIVENPSQLDGELGAASRLFKGEDMGFDSDYIQGITGDRLYNLIAALRTPGQAYASNFPTIKAGKRGFQDASEALAKAGIPGLKYYDGMSRYIDPEDAATKIPILEKYEAAKAAWEAAGSKGLGQEASKFRGAQSRAQQQYPGGAIPTSKSVKELAAKKRTRNFVTWDQDVLNRMKLLERNNEDMTKALMPK